MCIFKIVELVDCLLFIGQVGDRENLTCWSQERKNGDFFNLLQFENDDFYPQKKSNRKSCFIHCGAHRLLNNFEENHVLLLKCDDFMDVNLALNGV